jgi:hypothetical protein
VPVHEAAAEVASVEQILEEPAVDVAPLVEPASERPRFRERIRDSFLPGSRSNQAEDTEAPVEVTLAEIVDTPVAQPLSEPEVIVATVVDEEPAIVAELDSTKDTSTDSAPAFEDLLFPSGAPAELSAEAATDVRDAEIVDAEVVEVSFDEFVAELQAPAEEQAPVNPLPQTDGTGFTPPIGHWSTQALIDDDEQVSDGTVGGRDVAATSGALTTNALVLPSIPTADGIMGPLSGTGEILITGSINLPSSIGNTGVHPANYDHSDVDALLEATDREDAEPGSAPVRAIRAVSTNTGAGDVIGSMKPPKVSKVPMVLTITASSMGVGVIGLLVAGLIFKIF